MNGIERVVRLLQVPRRNYATAITRNSYRNRGNLYSDKGVAMRCVRPDQSSITVTLHYLNNGNSTMKFVCRKQEFLLPVVVVLKALAPLSDKEIYERIVCHDHNNSFLTTRLEILLRDAKQYNCTTCEQYRAYLGSLFRQYLPIDESFSDVSAGQTLINKFFFVHCSTMNEKVECCIHMLRKLFAFVQNKCCEDNADAFQNHEVLLPGHLINAIFKEKLEDMLVSFKQSISRDFNLDFTKALNEIQANTIKFCKRHVDRVTKTACMSISKFLNTGNIVSSSGLDLQQVSGYTIVAERLNIFRYHSHFQSIHRGQFFANMKTTAVRKLLPESWGFLCPVHTPDGSPCGLLNHLAREVLTVAYPTDKRAPTGPGGAVGMDPSQDSHNKITKGIHEYMSTQDFKQLLVKIGMVPVGLGGSDGHAILNTLTHVSVSLDGILIGAVPHGVGANEFVRTLRVLKATFGKGQGLSPLDSSGDQLDLKEKKKKKDKRGDNLFVNPFLEIAYFPPTEDDVSNIHAFPGIYMFTSPGRLIRPVINLETKTLEYIGPMEQVHMEIACLSQDIHDSTTHIETEPSVMLSQIAALTPYSDYNQSPRNMYQCQMGKQTMGTPAHALKMRGSDNKLYRIQNPQAPLVQNKAHRQYGMDNYPNGTNAVVCVIAYTGYDMEDAMIINKSSFERGFGHGCMYKTTTIDLDEEEKKATSRGKGMLGSAMRGKPSFRFDNVKQPPLPRRSESNNNLLSGEAHPGGDSSNEMVGEKYYEHLDIDGLPCEGDEINYGDVLCVYVDAVTGNHGIVTHKENEKAIVDSVRMLNVGSTNNQQQRVMTSNLNHSLSNNQLCRKVSITLRYPRKPVIGDKFSSRHGQKGKELLCSSMSLLFQ
jgi:DNA-directed RNA polymerase I subunit RPA2